MEIIDEIVTTSNALPFAKESGEESQPPKAEDNENVGAATATVEAAVVTVDETATISPEKEETTNEDETPANDEEAQKPAEATKGTCVEQHISFRNSI